MMKDRLATLVLGLVVTYFLLTIVLGSAGFGGFLIKGFISIWPAVWLAHKDIPIWSSLTAARNNTSSGSVTLPAKLLIFGQSITPPAFLADVFAQRATLLGNQVFHYGRGHQLVRGSLTDLGGGELAQRRLLEAMWESARLERASRGHRLKNRLNEEIWPTLYEDGFLIEEVQNDDGTTCAILANGIADTVSEATWVEAYAKGFGGFRSAWHESPRAVMKVRKKSGNGHWRVDLCQMPLFDLKLHEILLPGSGQTEQLGEAVELDMPDEWR